MTASPSKSQFLADSNVLIVLKGLKGAQTRFAILTARAVERGATLMTAVPRDESIRLLVLTDLDYHPTLQYLDVRPDSPSAARLSLVRPDWLSECMKKREKLPFAMFSVFIPAAVASSSSSLPSGPPPMDPNASFSDHHYRPHFARPVSSASAFAADLTRTPRPIDAFHQSPRSADRSLDSLHDAAAVASTSEREFNAKLAADLSLPRLGVPLPTRSGHSPAKSSSPHSLSAQSPGGGGHQRRRQPGESRRVHFAPLNRMRELSPDDPLRDILQEADDDYDDDDDMAAAESLGDESDTSASRSALHRPREPFNDVILRELDVIERNARQHKDVHRANVYRNGIGTVREIGKPIYSLEDLRGAAHFKAGGSLWMKVGEIIATGSLRRASALRESPEFQLRTVLSGVYGAGPAEVTHWIDRGVQSLEQLRDPVWCQQHDVDLPHNVQVGLRYHDALKLRLAREQVRAMVQHIDATVREIMPNATVIGCGSYRRGADTSSDVDVLVTRSGSDESADGMADAVVGRLTSSGVVLATLTTLREDSERFLGICQLRGGPVARVDIYCASQAEAATTLLHLTGSAEFNRALARRARQVGLSLSARGLRPVSGPKHAQVIGTPLELATEADIFRKLGVRWYEPRERSWVGLRDLDLVAVDGDAAQQPPPTASSTRKRPLPPTIVVNDIHKRAAFTDDDCAPPLDD
jgi:DNA polymerase/3'-5' exonuclease PolX